MTLAIIGDLILDAYQFFDAYKLSPEGPCPVVHKNGETWSLGGAGNVAACLVGLGFRPHLIFAQSKSSSESQKALIHKLCSEHNISTTVIHALHDAVPSTKTRYLVDGRQFFRYDLEPDSSELTVASYLEEKDIASLLQGVSTLIISDYSKGVLNEHSICQLLKYCRSNGIKTYVDSKKTNVSTFRDASVLKINFLEFQRLVPDLLMKNSPADVERDPLKYSNLFLSARNIIDCEELVVTLASYGSVSVTRSNVIHQIANTLDVVDITGAGDAFISGLAAYDMFTTPEDHDQLNRLKFSSLCSSEVIQRIGTVPISTESCLISRFKQNRDIRIGFANGCFDIVHPGHVELLREAKRHCDHLVVAINSDDSVRRLKGPTRPINSQEDRRRVIESIRYVDEVLIFHEDTPIKLIKQLNPDILFKGSDYREQDVVGYDYMLQYGGRVQIIQLLDGHSTSNIESKLASKQKVD